METRLGKNKPVGQGGQGLVTEVKEKIAPHRRGVLKEIILRWRGNEQARERMKKEVETLKKLHSLGGQVPEVYISSVDEGETEPYFIMSFIEGKRFDEWLKEIGSVEPTTAAKITMEIAKTISLCHENSIGHRDIKPANIIFKKGDVFKPYILDFGITFDSQQTYVLTEEGEAFRNEFINLPECQDFGGGHRDLRSDITALAGLFFSCITGKSPIVLRDAFNLAPHQRHEELFVKSIESPELIEQLMWFFSKAFSYAIKERFQTLDEFLEELAKFEKTNSDELLDLNQQVQLLDKEIRSTSREAQLEELQKKYTSIQNHFVNQISTKLKNLKKNHFQLSIAQLLLKNFNEKTIARFPQKELLGSPSIIFLQRRHLKKAAAVLLLGFAVEMEIHIYTANYSCPQNQITNTPTIKTFEKIAVFDSTTQSNSAPKHAAIAHAVKQKLALEISKIRRE